jgi:NitT/TauT family transport system ATP-binding protein
MQSRPEETALRDAGKAPAALHAVPDAGRRPMIQVAGLGVDYRTRSGETIRALEAIDLAVEAGEFCVIVGPSGCGKSTLLKVLAGLVRANGRAEVAGEPAGEPRDDVGFVFQSATLLPWSTILDNVLLPLKVQRRGDRANWRERGMELLRLVGLEKFAGSYPSELSGGMQQRVGMARALAHDPAILLMDEPFGALDALTRETMNQELQRIWLQRRKTVLFVTHSITEAVFLADRIVVMGPRPGRILDVVEVDLPRPRDFSMVDDPRFGELSRRIRSHLHGTGGHR